jgi:hypothetical protein
MNLREQKVLAMAKYLLAFRIQKHFVLRFLHLASNLSRDRFNRSIVPLGRSYFLMIPGTSCLATIVLSLRDKNYSPFEAPRIISAFMG